MGFFKIFKRRPALVDDTDRTLSCSMRLEPNEAEAQVTRSHKKDRSKKGVSRSRSNCKPVEKPNNLKAAEALLNGFNNFTSVENITKLFVDPDEKAFEFEDGFTLTPRQWAESVESTYASFPDMNLCYEDIKEISSSKVEIEGLFFSGTHTGQPFTFAPQFPAIAATGIHVINDEERMVLKMKNGKIQHVEVVSLGVHTGPPGAYELIGGSLTPPSSH